LLRIIRRLGASQHHRPAGGARRRGDLEHVAARHEVSADPDDRRRTALQNSKKLATRTERGVVNLHVKALPAQVRRKVKNPQRRVGLHNLKLLRIFAEEVAVGEEEVHKGSAFSVPTWRTLQRAAPRLVSAPGARGMTGAPGAGTLQR